MSPDSIIVQFVGSLILALLTGTWTPLPPDSISPHLPAPVTFSAQWQPVGKPGEVDQVIVLEDGSARLGATSSIVSPARGGQLAAGG